MDGNLLSKCDLEDKREYLIAFQCEHMQNYLYEYPESELEKGSYATSFNMFGVGQYNNSLIPQSTGNHQSIRGTYYDMNNQTADFTAKNTNNLSLLISKESRTNQRQKQEESSIQSMLKSSNHNSVATDAINFGSLAIQQDDEEDSRPSTFVQVSLAKAKTQVNID